MYISSLNFQNFECDEDYYQNYHHDYNGNNNSYGDDCGRRVHRGGFHHNNYDSFANETSYYDQYTTSHSQYFQKNYRNETTRSVSGQSAHVSKPAKILGVYNAQTFLDSLLNGCR